MKIVLTIFNFIVLAVYFLFLWDAIFNVKYELFNLDKKNEDEDEITSFLFDIIYFAYSFFNLILVMKVLHM